MALRNDEVQIREAFRIFFQTPSLFLASGTGQLPAYPPEVRPRHSSVHPKESSYDGV